LSAVAIRLPDAALVANFLFFIDRLLYDAPRLHVDGPFLNDNDARLLIDWPWLDNGPWLGHSTQDAKTDADANAYTDAYGNVVPKLVRGGSLQRSGRYKSRNGQCRRCKFQSCQFHDCPLLSASPGAEIHTPAKMRTHKPMTGNSFFGGLLNFQCY
jgi:hypothetical protein